MEAKRWKDPNKCKGRLTSCTAVFPLAFNILQVKTYCSCILPKHTKTIPNADFGRNAWLQIILSRYTHTYIYISHLFSKHFVPTPYPPTHTTHFSELHLQRGYQLALPSQEERCQHLWLAMTGERRRLATLSNSTGCYIQRRLRISPPSVSSLSVRGAEPRTLDSTSQELVKVTATLDVMWMYYDVLLPWSQ